MSTNTNIVAIDPGSNGAMVYNGHDFAIGSVRIDGDYESVCVKIKEICSCNGTVAAIVEDVGKHRIGNAASSSIKLARNHQNIKTALYMLGIETVDVSPQRWTKDIGVQVKDERTKEEKLRIRDLPEAERRRENGRHKKAQKDKKNEKIRGVLRAENIDESRIPDYALDAYGIYLWGKEKHRKD